MKRFVSARRWRTSRPVCAALLLAGCVAPPPPPVVLPEDAVPAVEPAVVEPVALPAPPQVPREFRGVWVAAVSNMDWPSRPGLPVARQQAELRAILDRAAALRLNAVILQVRPAGDALYASPHEPWSEYLTGQMGRAPEPFYDPLEFAIVEAHRRGLELHAWFNPYRARHPSARSSVAATHISRRHPDLVRRYGSHFWMDPGEPAVQDHSVRVILDVVRRYDIDGVHIDDYFYPYREYDARGKLIQFPDDASYQRYRARGGTLERGDWRRDNVNRFVERLYAEIKRERPAVKFGISPFGIWRPGHPEQIRGLDAYHEIFADARTWLHNGWLDYFTPQLYWPIEQQPQSFPVLLNWWVEQNHQGRHIWPGSFTSRVTQRTRNWPAQEILDQIEVTRAHPGATGNVHFSMSSLMRGRDSLTERLSERSYVQPALVPASPWLHAAAPGRPRVSVLDHSEGGVRLALSPEEGEDVFLWTVQARSASEWTTQVVPGWNRGVVVAGAPEQIVVTPVGRTGNEGLPVVLASRAGAGTLEVSSAGSTDR